MATRRVFLHPDGRRVFIHYEASWYAIWALDRYKQFDRAALNVLPVKTMAGDTGARLYAALEDWARAQHCDEITDPLVLARFEVDLACALRDRHTEQVANQQADAMAAQQPSEEPALPSCSFAQVLEVAHAMEIESEQRLEAAIAASEEIETVPVTVAETPDALEISREIPEATPAPVSVGVFLPIDQVHASPLNPRKSFNPETLDELAANIREFGVLQPLTVRPREEGGYWVIFGERRYRASLQAGLTEIPCIIRACDEVEHLRLAIIENLHRDQVDAIEEANGFQSLVQLGVPPAEIAAQVNRSPSYISNAMRLLELPEVVQVQIRTGALSASHGRALARFKPYPRLITALAKYVIEEHIASKMLERDQDIIVQSYGRALGVSVALYLNEYCGEYVTHFDWQRHCESCEDRRGAWCLNYGCWKNREAAFAESERKRKAALVAETLGGDINPDGMLAAAGGLQENRGIVSRSALKANDFDWLDKQTPSGCKPDCPQRGITKDHGENRAICLDPMCFAKLTAQDQERAKHDRQTLAEGRLARILSAMALTEAARLLAFGAWRVWQRMSGQELKRVIKEFPVMATMAERHGGTNAYSDGVGVTLLTFFATLPVDDLARFMAYGTLQPEIWDTVTSEYSPTTPLADWFLGEATPAPIRVPDDLGEGDAVIQETPRPLVVPDACDGPAFCDDWQQDGDCASCPLLKTCRICGCTPEHACTTADGPCYWVTNDLCSGCAVNTVIGVQLLVKEAPLTVEQVNALPLPDQVTCARGAHPTPYCECSHLIDCRHCAVNIHASCAAHGRLQCPDCPPDGCCVYPDVAPMHAAADHHLPSLAELAAADVAGNCPREGGPLFGVPCTETNCPDNVDGCRCANPTPEGELPDPPDPICEGLPPATTLYMTAPLREITESPCKACTADQCPPGGKTQCDRFMTWSEVAR